MRRAAADRARNTKEALAFLAKLSEMRFASIATEKAQYPVALLNSVLQVSRAGFYAWQHRPVARRTLQEQGLGLEIAAIFAESGGSYGSARVNHSSGVRSTRAPRAVAR